MTKIDWSKLTFSYTKTNTILSTTFKEGKWSPVESLTDDNIRLSTFAGTLHYAIECFEGLKAFRGKDGKIRVFRTEENGKRLQDSARGIMMEPIPLDLFKKMVLMAVKLNERFVPPYGSGASLYIRPFEIGTSARVGVKPADEYTFIILVTPVGPYFKNGFKPTNFAIMREFDRVAPKGTGRIKVGGNYAASLVAGEKAHDLGFSGVLYLDSKEKKYLDECGAANFFAIKDNTYITPYSESILPSITNKSLTQIAEDLGMKVERRPIEVEELATFEEAGACGTAAVCTPIGEIVDLDNDIKYTLAKDGNPGEMTTKLYNHLRGIQDGEIEDIHGWCDFVE